MPRIVAVICLASALLSPVAAAADVVLEWNAIMVQTVKGTNPFAQGRIAAITQLAVFTAVNAITGEYRPYLRASNVSSRASVDAAAVAAGYRVLVTFFPGSAAALDLLRANSLAEIADGQEKADGIAVGEAAAAAVLALRVNDGGAAAPQFHVPPSTRPGEWQLTNGCPAAGGILLHWRNVAPFGIKSSSQFRADPPPSLKSDRYAKSYREVKEVGGVNSTARPADRATVANFYNLVLVVETWNNAVRQVAAVARRSPTENARAFALLNMAISDGLVSVMETKYHYRLWRPETAIPAGNLDGNRRTEIDPDFVPFIPTPCFPSYPSAHAAGSNAARAVAERIFGPGHHSIVLESTSVPGVALYYRRFSEITDDIDDARVYGGIHFRFDQEAGARQGRRIGSYVYEHTLRPLHGRGPRDAKPAGDDRTRR